MFPRCFLDFSVGVEDFVIELSQISSFFRIPMRDVESDLNGVLNLGLASGRAGHSLLWRMSSYIFDILVFLSSYMFV